MMFLKCFYCLSSSYAEYSVFVVFEVLVLACYYLNYVLFVQSIWKDREHVFDEFFDCCYSLYLFAKNYGSSNVKVVKGYLIWMM